MRRSRRSAMKAAAAALALLLCVGACALLGGILYLFNRVEAAFGPPKQGVELIDRLYLSTLLFLQSDALIEPSNRLVGPLAFEVALGESPQSIASRLEAAGAIPDAGAFLAYLEYAGLDRTIQAGGYQLEPSLSPVEIAGSLQDATPKVVTFSILPGWRLEEIAASLPTSGLEFSPAEFLAATRAWLEDRSLFEELPPGTTLEGFLYPGIYEIPRQSSVQMFLAILLDSFESRLAPDLLAGFERQRLTLYEAVTLASIVQRESVLPDEMPIIASVFLNRLAIEMPLEADSTVQYALGYNDRQKTWWTNPLTSRDLQVDSPYNTYRYPGLPPSPIANPGEEALRAVAFPAKTGYYYFRAACDGSGRHVFATTYAEHLQNACPP